MGIEKKRILFIISSCVSPWKEYYSNGTCRTGCSIDERLAQTMHTISSIRQQCCESDIMLVDNGSKNYAEVFEELVDQYYYVGNIPKYKISSMSSNKGIGESYLMLFALKHLLYNYEFIYKISGRYFLSDAFDFRDWDFKAFNFLNYGIDGEIKINNSMKYIKGSHSTRLYGFPGDKVKVMKKLLRKGLIRETIFRESIETAMSRGLRDDKVAYHKILGIEGMIAGITYIKE